MPIGPRYHTKVGRSRSEGQRNRCGQKIDRRVPRRDLCARDEPYRAHRWIETYGGPHLLLAEELHCCWRGIEGWHDHNDPKDLSDYARACRLKPGWAHSLAMEVQLWCSPVTRVQLHGCQFLFTTAAS